MLAPARLNVRTFPHRARLATTIVTTLVRRALVVYEESAHYSLGFELELWKLVVRVYRLGEGTGCNWERLNVCAQHGCEEAIASVQ